MAQRQGESSRAPLGGKHIPLHFTERNGPFRRAAICMKHGILRIFPSLMDEPVLRPAAVLHKAIAIEISRTINPLQRTLDIRPDLCDEGLIARPFVIGSGQHNEQRRRVDAAVVAAERNLIEGRHFSLACLMQNFANLGILLREHLPRLGRRQIGQHTPGDAWIDPQKFECGDEAVAAERGAEPWDPGVGVWAVGGV